MAVAITNTADPAGVAASSNVATYADLSIGVAANDRVIVLVVGSELASSAATAATIDYGDGVYDMEAGSSQVLGAVYAQTFYLTVRTGTTATFRVTFGATNPSETQNHVAVYRVVGGAMPTIGGTSDTDADPISTGAVTVPASGGMLAICSDAAGGTARTWTGLTESLDEDAGAGAGTFRFSTGLINGGGSITTTVSGGNNEDAALSYLVFGPGSPTRRWNGAANFAGVGAWSLDATIPAVVWQGEATFAGIGAFDNYASLAIQASAALSGAGLLDLEATTSREPLSASAEFAGIGSFAVATLHFSAGVYDETGAATLAVSGNAFTELEFGLKLDFDNLQTGDVLNFRVYFDGSPLDSYLLTPSLTVAAHAINATAAWAGAGGWSLEATVSGAPLEASAALAGVGQFDIAPQLLAQASAAFAGIGAWSADATAALAAQAAFAGVGSLTVDLTKLAQAWQGSAELVGLGALSVEASRRINIGAESFTGSGSLTASTTALLAATAAFAGAGSATITPQLRMAVQASFAGAGLLAVDMLQLGKIDGSALFAGVGTLAATTRQILAVNALYAGSGTFAIQPGLRIRGGVTAALAGAGLLDAQSSIKLRATASWAGAGTLATASNMLLSPRATWAGAGLQSVNATRTVNLIAEAFSGAGLLTAASRLKLAALGQFDGAGAFSIVPRLRMRALANFSGEGSLYVNLTPPIIAWQGQAQFDGIGELTAIAGLLLPIAAQLEGAGSFSADAIRFVVLSEEFFAGTGSLIVDTTAALGAVATYGGEGLLTVEVTMTSAREYWLVCSSLGINPEVAGEISIDPAVAGEAALAKVLAGKAAMRKC